MKLTSEQLNRVNWQDEKSIINFYNTNKIYFKNHNLIEDEDELVLCIGVLLKYAHVLFDQFHFVKAQLILENVRVILARLNNDTNHKNFVQREKFIRGMILGHEGKFKLAHPIFKELVAIDPDHHFYQVWYFNTKIGLYNWILNSLFYISIAIIFFDILAEYLFDFQFKNTFTLLIIAVILMISSTILQYFVKIYYTRKSNFWKKK